MQENKIMHRDFQLNNILLDENNDIKISDFSFSAILRDNFEENEQNILLSNFTKVGSLKFVAPEILKQNQYDYKEDIFSLGLTMLCLISKSNPISITERVRKIDQNKIDEDNFNKYLINLIKRMILENPILRPSAAEALEQLDKIEYFLKNPSSSNEKKLNADFPTENIIFLGGIGTKQEDFESINSEDKDYTLLGKSDFGYFEKMKSKLNNKIYAIKKIFVTNNITIDFIREITFMIHSNHMNILKLYGYFQGIEKIQKIKDIYKNDSKKPFQNDTEDKNVYFLVLDYMPEGSLENCYNSYKSKGIIIKQDFIIKFFKQILAGLKYLHANGVMHRDIKLDNILLDKNYNIKISDFSIAALYKEKNANEDNTIYNNTYYNNLFSNFTRVGPMKFVAPEILAHKQGMKYDYDYKVDIFTLGLSMLILVSKTFPISIENKIRKIDIENINEIYNEYLINLIKRMISFDQNIRPSAAEALDELNKIEILIKNPDNKDLTSYLDEKNKIITNTNEKNNSQINKNNDDNIGNNKTESNIPKLGSNNLDNPENIIPPPKNDLFQVNNFNNNISFNQGIGMEMGMEMKVQNPNPMSLSSNIALQNSNTNTSLLCILKILFFCFKDITDNLTSFNPGNFAKVVLNTIKFMGDEPVNYIQISNLNNNIQHFRDQISSVIPKFIGSEEIFPFFVYHELYTKLNDELRKDNIGIEYNNSILNNLSLISGLDLIYFNDVYQKIFNYKMTLQSPIFDYFYYIFIEVIRCPYCSSILKANVNNWCYFEFNDLMTGTISNLIYNYFYNYNNCFGANNNYYPCNQCLTNRIGIKNLSFLMRPKYLTFSFNGNTDIILDDNIDLSQYSYPNNTFTGPTHYSLFAFIEINNDNYYAYIRINKIWYLYNDGKMELSNVMSFIALRPFIAIYKGEY